MKYAFIGGIPAAGKSYLAEKLSGELKISHHNIDEWREELASNPEIEPWVNFYWNKDEKGYYAKTSCEEQWKNLTKQSEVFWPVLKKKMLEIVTSKQPAIFECVNILPHLAKELPFSGVYLLGNTFEEILERNKREPRWGNTEELQRMEAESFFYCERKWYKKEAEHFGFKTFTNSEDAEKELRSLLTI